jgi:hypothetical protein
MSVESAVNHVAIDSGGPPDPSATRRLSIAFESVHGLA